MKMSRTASPGLVWLPFLNGALRVPIDRQLDWSSARSTTARSDAEGDGFGDGSTATRVGGVRSAAPTATAATTATVAKLAVSHAVQGDWNGRRSTNPGNGRHTGAALARS